MPTENIGPCAYYQNITFLIAQCVGKMIQVSNQLLQRDATEIQFLLVGMTTAMA